MCWVNFPASIIDNLNTKVTGDYSSANYIISQNKINNDLSIWWDEENQSYDFNKVMSLDAATGNRIITPLGKNKPYLKVEIDGVTIRLRPLATKGYLLYSGGVFAAYTSDCGDWEIKTHRYMPSTTPVGAYGGYYSGGYVLCRITNDAPYNWHDKDGAMLYGGGKTIANYDMYYISSGNINSIGATVTFTKTGADGSTGTITGTVCFDRWEAEYSSGYYTGKTYTWKSTEGNPSPTGEDKLYYGNWAWRASNMNDSTYNFYLVPSMKKLDQKERIYKSCGMSIAGIAYNTTPYIRYSPDMKSWILGNVGGSTYNGLTYGYWKSDSPPDKTKSTTFNYVKILETDENQPDITLQPNANKVCTIGAQSYDFDDTQFYMGDWCICR